jgi:succinate-acetate transporter protein
VNANGRRHFEQTRIMLRPVGSGLPLGFFSFGIGMLLLGSQAVGWIPASEQRDVGLLLAAFVFPLELVAMIFAFLARDTLGATTLGLFTTSWLALGLSDLNAPAGSTSITLGIYLFGFATAAGLLALLSTMGKPFFTALLSLAVARMVLSGLYEVGAAGKHVFHAAGWCGVVLAGLAMYGGTALGLEDAKQRDVLPLFRRGQAAASFEASYDDHLERLESEPGVRPQL